MSAASKLLVLGHDVLFVPVTELPEASRQELDCREGDVAVSRVEGRSGSTVIDAQAAELLACFREPRSIVEAAILFGRRKQRDPDQVLQGSYALLRRFQEQGVLVAANGDAAPEPPRTRWKPDDAVMGSRVLRVLQVLDDTEIYLLADARGDHRVLKLERQPGDVAYPSVRLRIENEAAVLDRLAGELAPRLLRSGKLDGRSYVEMAYCPGIDAERAGHEARHEGDARALELSRNIAAAYARLHELGVLHADVHPRNILVDASGAVRLLDFGLARPCGPGGGAPASDLDRGGVPFFFEPELAQAYLDGVAAPPPSPAGEQFALAALLYLLVTGSHWQDFRLEREAMLRDIAEKPPRAFSERGRRAWPELEQVLARALAKRPVDRFRSMQEFADALARVPAPAATGRAPVERPAPACDRLIRGALESTRLDGPLYASGPQPAPVASVTYGAAGVGLGLLHMACARGDAGLLATADAWAQAARRTAHEPTAFYNGEIDITPEVVGSASPFHTDSGIHAVQALIARARGDAASQEAAVTQFLEAAGRPAAGWDLTLGRSSVLLACAILLDAVRTPAAEGVRGLGDQILEDLWRYLDARPSLRQAGIEYPGAAHGWAGFAYASLQWCAVSGATVPEGLARRLDELAELALPSGRGLEWPWVLRNGEHGSMPGWCNGTAGHVFLWTLAHRILGSPRYLEIAEGAGWHAWESHDTVGTLCCGTAGRAYALLNLHRHGGDTRWLERAKSLVVRAAGNGHIPPEYPHSLYKGGLGLAVVASELEEPGAARMPLFEPFGYGANGAEARG